MGFFNKTKIKTSGTHTTLKKELPLAQAYSSIRIPEKEKGSKNPAHIQINISKWFRKTKEQ